MIKLLLEPVNFLILDEPTNHLDMRSKEVLKEAIRDFDGTAVIVSHDRDFLDELVTKVYEFGGGFVKEHLGGIYEFLQRKQLENLNELQPSASSILVATFSETNPISESRISYEAMKEQNKRIKRLEKQIDDCEKQIETIEIRINELETKIATPKNAANASFYLQHQQLKEQLDKTEDTWEQYSMELERLINH